MKRKAKGRGPGSSWNAPLLLLWQRHSGWELGLLALGALSFISIIIILFMPIGKGPSLMTPSGLVPAASDVAFPRFVSEWMTIPLDETGRPEVLEDGDAIIPRLLGDIDRAQLSIEFMAYIWKDGQLSDLLLKHLVKKQREGVQVRILLDGYGGLLAPRSKLEQLEDAGGKVSTFHTLLPAPWAFMRTTKRNHRRAIVIDGQIGYTGGLGVDDVWLGHALPPKWHDLMFRLQGSIARRLEGSFSELWAMTTGELITDASQHETEGTLPYVLLSASPSPDLYQDETLVLLTLIGARKSIEIETPYFLPDASIRKLLIDKAKTGVDVKILLPNDKTDERSVRWAGQRIYEELLRGGVKIYEYQPTFTHTKLLIEDGRWSLVGSANMDIRSRRLNDEVVIGIQDEAFANELGVIFARDLGKSKQIVLSEWTKRGPLQRGLELISQAFVQQY
jgi:cardiolipin synthase